MSTITKISRLSIMEWSRLLQYRTDVLLWAFAEAIIPLVAMAIWYTISLSSTSGPSTAETLTYYILVIGIKIATDAWNGFFMSEEILNGDLVKYLTRPVSYFWKYITNNLVEKSLKFAVLIPILVLCIIWLQHSLSPQIFMLSQWPLFITSVLFAAILAFTLASVFGLLAFWLEDARQLLAFKNMLEIVASGILIPFASMPENVKQILSFLPFRYMISAPAEIMLNTSHQVESFKLIAIQLLWILLTTMIIIIFWKKGLKRYAIPGQ